MSTKFKTADGYDADVTRACETALVVLLRAFGSLRHTLRLVGGLVPRYLTPEQPPDIPVHAGTTDVDVVLNVSVLAERGTYDKLRRQLKDNGFMPYETEQGKVSKWQWVYELKGLPVVIEFLLDAGDPSRSGKLVEVDGEDVSALQILHASIAHEWFEEREVRVELPDGDGVVTEVVRYADAVAFLVLKTLAFDQRSTRKDVADLIHVMRHWRTVDELAELYAQRLRTSAHSDALRDVLGLLEKHFCDDDRDEGWTKDGPSMFANFHQVGQPGGDAFVLEQRDVSGMVMDFVGKVRALCE
ncbi:MAG: hypothetical protein QM740_20995 [Acidovorax sp.]